MRVGIVGKRGGAFVSGLRSVPGVDIVAVCDLDLATRTAFAERHGIESQTDDFRRLLDADIDAIAVATPMQFHAEQSIAALEAGKHVVSEVTAAVSLDECQRVVAAARRSSATYMMAENYCFSRSNAIVGEMARRGVFGDLYYAEGAYIHDCHHVQYDAAGNPTWRTIWQVGSRGCTYGTHSLGPVLTWIDDRVASVTCHGSGVHSEQRHIQDDVTVMLCQLARGGLADIRLDMQSRRPHNMTHYALQGTRGAYLSGRHPGESGLVWIDGRSPSRETWEPLDAYRDEFTPLEWREYGAQAAATGHGGGDFFAARAFALSVTTGTTPPIGIDRAMDFTLPGVLSAQSIASGGVPVAVPDSREW
ncbi:MAG: Gfo/Idh/MocA family oxidoreductase [Chloroflexota bacterium]|nr:MAG: Gfo/Idh/MocA family oxidoreductase [Chloroflexota bacterium]